MPKLDFRFADDMDAEDLQRFLSDTLEEEMKLSGAYAKSADLSEVLYPWCCCCGDDDSCTI